MMLRKKIKQEQAVTGQTGPNIVDEIQRQTTVIFNDNGQWKSTPLGAAMKAGILSADEFREVEGEIVFFMVSSAIQKPELIKPTVGSVIGMFGGQLTLSSATEWRDSLSTSKRIPIPRTRMPRRKRRLYPPRLGVWRGFQTCHTGDCWRGICQSIPVSPALYSLRIKRKGLFQWQLNPLLIST